MKSTWRLPMFIVMLGSVPRIALAQTADPASGFLLTLPTPGVAASDSRGNGALAFVLLMVATTAILVAIAKVVDFRNKREEQMVLLEAQIAEALIERPAFFRSSVNATVDIPFWRGSPARITMTGEVPSPYLVQSALRVATQAASRIRPDFSIKNRMAVVPSAEKRAA